MTRFCTVVTLALLTGCMLMREQPEQAMQNGSAHSATLHGSTSQAAYCIESNAHNPSATGIANHLPLVDGTGLEVIIRRVGDPAGTIAIAHLRQDTGGGTAANMWVSPNILDDSDAVAQKLYEGC
jgi:hypothetical protein